MLGKDACTEDVYTALHASGCRDLHPRATAEPPGLLHTGTVNLGLLMLSEAVPSVRLQRPMPAG